MASIDEKSSVGDLKSPRPGPRQRNRTTSEFEWRRGEEDATRLGPKSQEDGATRKPIGIAAPLRQNLYGSEMPTVANRMAVHKSLSGRLTGSASVEEGRS